MKALTHAQLDQVHEAVELGEEESYLGAARLLLELAEYDLEAKVDNPTEGAELISNTFFGYLYNFMWVEAALVAWGSRQVNPEPRCVQLVLNAINTHKKVLAMGGSAQAKCLGKGTKVLMFDGSVKSVEDVVSGDLLMGDDSSPRRVLSTAAGHGKMFKITPTRGEPWRCNEDHILTLKCATNRLNGDHKTVSSNFRKGAVIDIPALKYRSWSKKARGFYRQFTVGVDFPAKPVPFDPFIYGMWLGDGGVGIPVLHNVDQVLIKTWCDYFKSIGYRIVVNYEKRKGNCHGYYARINGKYQQHIDGKRVRNEFTVFVRRSFIDGQKRILPEYLINSREVRLKILCGLLDTDGSASYAGYSLVTKYPGLADDVAYLARSLGFFASIHVVFNKRYKRNYWKIRIGGNLEDLPTLLKKATPRKGPTDHTLTRIEIAEDGEDNYYGFTLDGNGRFLLGDFTVTHNTYTATWRYLLRWVLDPEYTLIKLISTTAGHAMSNIYSQFVRMHDTSIVKLPGLVRQDYIGMSTNEQQSSITRVAIKDGESGKAALRGFHPTPRPKPHPLLGNMSFSIAILDEAEGIPDGVWTGVDNIVATENAAAYAATNPFDITSQFALRAEPLHGGWLEFDRDTDVEWQGHQRWRVVRLDPSKSENVVQKRLVYEGFMSREEWEVLEEKGKGSAERDAFGHGCYPSQSVEYQIWSPNIIRRLTGSYTFIEAPFNWASFDGAYAEGGDRAMLTTGKYGLAESWTDVKGKVWPLMIPRHCLYAEQQFEIERVYLEGKPNSILMGNEIIEICTNLHVAPEWFVMDKQQPISEPVLTPGGWRPIGDLAVGDFVIGSDGRRKKVIGVYPQMNRSTFKVSFTDGSWTRCGPEHLWTVFSARNEFSKIPRTVTTETLAAMISKKSSAKWQVPMLSSPAQLTSIPPMDGYVLGALLGDGNLRKTAVRFSSADQFVVEEVNRRLPEGHRLNPSSSRKYDFELSSRARLGHDGHRNENKVFRTIKALGLAGVKSHEKWIPDCYLSADSETRIALLRGLMDTDGYCDKTTGNIGLKSTSERLTKDCANLAESLGCSCRLRNGRKEGMVNTGVGISFCRQVYVLTICPPDWLNPFLLPRKADRVRKRTKRPIGRYVKSIEPVEAEDSVCIKVDSDDELYITRHCILTHNTGNGVGIHDYLRLEYGGILGIEWGETATALKIIEEDTKTAEEQFDGIISEMWFGAQQWAEYDLLKVAPGVNARVLFQQLGNRKYKFVKRGLRRAESKKDYKDRPPHRSPDEADSFIMAPQLARVRGKDLPKMTKPPPPPKPRSLWDSMPSERAVASVQDKPYKWVKT